MNDPHVVALFYKIIPDPSVDYRNAQPLKHEQEEEFSIHIEDREIHFTMKTHYATESKALEAVREYIHRWEFDVALREESSAFKLAYQYATIGDRKPTPGMASGKITVKEPLSDVRTVHSNPYPPPPPLGLTITPDVQSMYDRLMGCLSGREFLPSMAYFCLTVLEDSTGEPSGRRSAAGTKYGIDWAVLNEIGRLSSKGGPQARKADGIGRPLTLSEDRFLKKAIVALTRRAAEVAAGPVSRLPKIKLTDLPQC